ELSVFGIGTELREAQWRGVVRQLLAQGLLTVQGEFQTLALTEDSGEVLRGQRQVLLRRDVPVPKAERAARQGAAAATAAGARLEAGDLSTADAAVFERLRAWRGTCAKEQGVPAYVVFHDATLRQIAAVAPATLAELSEISGVGEAKLARYGEQILRLLTAQD
ncbi:HRDC domain-containing protein, partial [Trebonia sp.]|uniref:HRDC domain-containing protein n=1 Tax=Trebonia sp. TaxID=2767075 RepID=UPI0026223B56